MKKRPVRIEGGTAIVTLTKGYFAFCDAADAELVGRYNWAAKETFGLVYAVVAIKQPDGSWPQIRMHRMLCPTPADLLVDHRDGNGLNNRRGNLRPATNLQNLQNKKLHCDNTSGFRGVYRDKRVDRWYARIMAAGVLHSLGGHATAIEASAAYDAAAKRFYGEFARAEVAA